MCAVELRVCKSPNGRAPFADWFHKLDRKARFKISAALFQMEEGNCLVILLGGGSKRKQALDIRRAQALWVAYQTKFSSE
jgi:putative component of toxin-antitoxin plasmid stabilization module